MTFPFPFTSHFAGLDTTGEYRTTVSTGDNLTTYTFTDVDVGTENEAREVIILCGWGNQLGIARHITSATIGGVAATVLASASGVGSVAVGALQANVPTGATATVVINLDGTVTRMGIAVYKVVPRRPTPYDVVTAVDSGGATAVALNVDVSADGFLMSLCFSLATVDIDPNYNGVDTPVVNFDADVETSRCLAWSCVTTETVSTNDAGGTQDSGTADMRTVAVSFA